MKVPSLRSFASPIFLLATTMLGLFFLASQNVNAENLVFNDTESIFAGGPEAPVVEGVGGPDKWLIGATSTVFKWNLSDDITAVAVSIATTSGEEPTKAYRPPISEFSVDSSTLEDGIYYLSVQFKNDVKWGKITESILRVDNTPPEQFNISVKSANNDGGFVMSLTTIDTLSGVDHYDVYAGEKPPLSITADKAAKGFIIMPDHSGDYLINVRAFDKAGNYKDESVTVLVANTEALRLQNQELVSRQTETAALVGLLTVLILVLLTFFVYERKRYNERIKNIQVETEEIHSQLIRIFNALRDEIHDQIRSITKRSKLTKAEKEAVDGLGRALDVSESLIDKEINDVKKIAK